MIEFTLRIGAGDRSPRAIALEKYDIERVRQFDEVWQSDLILEPELWSHWCRQFQLEAFRVPYVVVNGFDPLLAGLLVSCLEHELSIVALEAERKYRLFRELADADLVKVEREDSAPHELQVFVLLEV